MAGSNFHSTFLLDLIARIRAGEDAARNDLIVLAQNRMTRMVRSRLRKYPKVCRWVEEGDVFNEVAMKLLGALEKVPPPGGRDVTGTRGFLAYTGRIIGHHVTDLGRRLYGPLGIGTNHPPSGTGAASAPRPDPPAPADDPVEYEQWVEMHAAIPRLSHDDEREAVQLYVYHHLSYADIAAVQDVHPRTAERRIKTAILELQKITGYRPPPLPAGPG